MLQSYPVFFICVRIGQSQFFPAAWRISFVLDSMHVSLILCYMSAFPRCVFFWLRNVLSWEVLEEIIGDGCQGSLKTVFCLCQDVMDPRMYMKPKLVLHSWFSSLYLSGVRITVRSYVLLFIFSQLLWYSNFGFWSLDNWAFPMCLGTSHIFCPKNIIRMWIQSLFRMLCLLLLDEFLKFFYHHQAPALKK